MRDCTNVAGTKFENLFEASVDKILKASITPFVRFWISTLRFHEICNCSSTLHDNKRKGAKGGWVKIL